MAYSLRTRSASAVKPETATATPAAPVKKAAVKKTPAAPKKAPAKKATAAPKKATAASKKTVTEVKEQEPVVVEAKTKEPAKPKAKKAATPKTKAPAKKAATPKAKAPAKKAAPASKKVTKAAAPKAKAPARKAAAAKKGDEKKVAPIVKIEEIDEELQTPSMPEVEPISHEEEEKIIEIVEGQVVNTHIRFSDAEEEEEEMKPATKEISITSEDFEALEDFKDDPVPFELYTSEEVETEMPIEKDDFTFNNLNDEFDEPEAVREPSPVSNAHSAFEAFTSQEESKTFNWNHSGSTYYGNKSESEPEVAKIEDMPSVVASVQGDEVKRSPVVISNPFGFGFTATTAPIASEMNAPTVNASNPNPYTFNNSHFQFQSVSSPLDKLCNLTCQSNPMTVASTFGINNNSSSMMATSSYLPTSPAAGISKASRSPSLNGEDKDARSPSAIQSIIVDDKHEDFSAF